ncbi:MAG: hypothetical protein HEQ35_30510 [Gloeotrichia echinulata IR180]
MTQRPLSASLGTQRPLSASLGTQRPLSASLGIGDWVTSLIVSRFYHQLMS